MIPAWHGQRRLTDLHTDGPFEHCRRPIGLARVWTDRYLNTERKPERGLYFYGGVGTGKTSIAAAMAVELDCTFWAVRDLIARAKEEMNCKVRDSVWDKVVRARVLVIDDIGKQRATPYVVEQMQDVIERRFDRQHLTIVTSNLGPEEMAGFLGAPAWSRFIASSVPVPVVGANLREQAA